ncbi:toprim domain-containing protein [Thermogemmatispora sp.]|uniref:toprim domain-containing protein n=1 Tax=Thermogemmatispora sp. TaxID=1968838 RepID=UPI0035E4622A
MITVFTRQGKRIEILSQSELWHPRLTGGRVRAFCPIHGSDHQRSLSIDPVSGWGRCFNAACQANVLIREWNPQAAYHLLGTGSSGELVSQEGAPERSPVPRLSALARQKEGASALNVPSRWQQEERRLLEALEPTMQAALQASAQGRAYLGERAIPLEIALSCGVGLLTPAIIAHLPRGKQRRLLQRWSGRLIFPLRAEGTKGYIGRTLWGWRPGMDENDHKQLLERLGRPQRWIKTNPAGSFSLPWDQLASKLILVEGTFDRLALLSAGFLPEEVVALAGTALPTTGLPPHVRHVLLALDGDEGGREATARLSAQLREQGRAVTCCLIPRDGRGKDWNERWRLGARAALEPLLDSYRRLY